MRSKGGAHSQLCRFITSALGIIQGAVVRRVYDDLGLLLELPVDPGVGNAEVAGSATGKKKRGKKAGYNPVEAGTGPTSQAAAKHAGFVHISNAGEEHIDKLKKFFKTGQVR